MGIVTVVTVSVLTPADKAQVFAGTALHSLVSQLALVPGHPACLRCLLRAEGGRGSRGVTAEGQGGPAEGAAGIQAGGSGGPPLLRREVRAGGRVDHCLA